MTQPIETQSHDPLYCPHCGYLTGGAPADMLSDKPMSLGLHSRRQFICEECYGRFSVEWKDRKTALVRQVTS